MTKRFTGRHMLICMLAFFGVIITVNLIMATFATRTFGGIVVDNSYVASQKYNGWLAKARAQQASGWSGELTIDANRRPLLVASIEGGSLAGAEVSAIARHPVGREADVALRFDEVSPGVYRAREPLPAGRWILHLTATRDGRDFRMIEDAL
ncbi:FixH family protein [Sphingosinicella sp. LY1275]|uniref:FixH family protein n=1 Tax=Sphingosinicella sp. LY1275 TaxID=3095379 RepID=UPI002ADEF50B|nr:FixH family protein [Sphingosinicella sp. LY1275]MEA1015309.1 FixH family protein [Sphingosinicella sp. LY1275]